MSRFFEKTLPAGYAEARVIDVNDRQSSSKIGILACATVVVLFNAIFFLWALPRRKELLDSFSILKCVGFAAAYFLYIALHELTHGLVYKLLTGQKLSFGFKPPAVYCGLPDVYVYRITSLASLFAPLTVYTILFAALFFLVGDPFTKLLVLALLALHLSGCAGDLYNIGLFLFRYQSPATLRRDTGPTQIYYVVEQLPNRNEVGAG